ncbi:hypothetical protein Goklo_025033, partial [Gossypium klotzschianum]|nr:hypothetical protein [Gossypium klotzschianum]
MCIAITRMVPLSFWKVDKVSYRGAIGYAPLLVLRQYRSRQFIPAT